MERRYEILIALLADTFMNPVTQLFSSFFLISFFSGTNIVKIGLSYFLDLIVILQLNRH